MSSIRVDAKALQQRADQLLGEARNIGAVMESLSDLSTSLRNEWAGEESDLFAKWYHDEFRPSLIEGQETIEKFVDAINTCAQEMLGE